jgi:hypothetical protein
MKPYVPELTEKNKHKRDLWEGTVGIKKRKKDREKCTWIHMADQQYMGRAPGEHSIGRINTLSTGPTPATTTNHFS